ncbi:linear gramicidin synthase subunit D [Kordia sp. SMS9]|uniref:non-ribosomal peptide synthetase n=1 Tax=Kordia sp. SMS9 TaxID=2282170 RepID=UPI000E0CFCF9|nr:non-ribosomal peptide synthetase [Kordia sp. SMS9]AXG70726.1 linear gramicidin synthase subunit D [Kordia sp. SMS9]
MKSLLDILYKLGVRLEVQNNDLKIKAPQGVLTSFHIQEIKKYKEDLVTLLSVDTTSNIPKAPIQSWYPLTSAQKRIWMLSQFGNANKAYNIVVAFEMEGILNKKALQKAFEYVLERHDSLRTSFIEKEGEVFQQITPAVECAFSIQYSDQTESNTNDINQFFEFDIELTKAPLLGARLLKTSETKHILIAVLHHSIGDGWSMEVFSRELVIAYNAYCTSKAIELPALAIQYPDYAVWKNQHIQTANHTKAASYWLEKFQGELPSLQLPSFKKRPAVKTYNGNTTHFKFSSEFHQQITQFSKDHEVTLFVTLLAGINAFLHRYTDQDDIIIGTPVAGREHPDLQHQIGLFINTMAIRTQIASDDTFATIVQKEKENFFEAYQHQSYPFDEFVAALQLQRDMSRSALFDIMVVLQSQSQLQSVATDNFFTGLTTKPYQVAASVAMFDLSFAFAETETLKLALNYNTDCYSSAFINRFLVHFERFFYKIISTERTTPIRQVNYLSKAEIKAQVTTYNQTSVSYPKHKTLVDILQDQVHKTPDSVAVVFEETSLTYKEIEEKSNQFAQYLKEKYNPQPNDTIAIQLERSEWLIISILGILKSGAAYVPMATAYPESRAAYICADASCKTIINEAELAVFKQQAATFKNTLPTQEIRPENIAYIIYTSGTTGNPKGVMITHKNCVNYMSYFNKEVHNISLTCKIIFDVSVKELFTALTSGSTLYIAKEETTFQPEAYANYLYENKISYCYLHPMHVHLIANALDVYEEIFLKKIILGVEAIKPEMVSWYLSKNIKVINAYGPSETTICATAYEVKSLDAITTANIPIGKPIDNYQVYILDSTYNTLQPTGILGEICISGDGVGKGYINQPELTAQKFIPHPFIKGEILYKTGDLGRKLPDGNLEFIGRSDRQIKIRGHRIELGEIEAALTKISELKVAYVEVQVLKKEKYLVAYYTSSKKLQATTLRKQLQTQLPAYMLPSFYIEIPKLPLTVNGKIDRKKLPEVDLETKVQTEYVAAKTTTQQQLVTIWKHVLEVPQIGITNSFFELGGHSMKAMQLVNQINAVFGSNLQMRDVFLYPTITTISKQLFQENEIQIQPAEVKESYALSNIQQQIWVESQIAEGSKAYHMPFVIEISGKKQLDIVQEAMNCLIARHEILRTVFRKDDEETVKQWILDAKEITHSYDYHDFTNQEDCKGLIDNYVEAQHEKLFDLENGPLLHYALFHIPDNKSVFYLKLHHIIADGWSIQILLKELFTQYETLQNNTEQTLSSLAIHYKDYAAWEQQITSEASVHAHEAFWKKTLSGTLPIIDLPTTKVRPKLKTYSGAIFETSLSAETSKQLHDFSIAHEGSTFMTLLAIWNVVLHKYTGLEDILVGSPIATRKSEVLEPQIGPYINTIGLRNTIATTQNFEEFFATVKENTLAAFSHEMYPLAELGTKMNLQRDRSRSPIFDVLFTSQNMQSSIVDKVIPSEDEFLFRENVSSKFDLNLSFYEHDGTIILGLNFNPDVYEAHTIQQLLGHYKAFISKLLRHTQTPIAKISVLSELEQQFSLQASQSKEVTIDSKETIISRFQNIVRQYPENTAVQTPNSKYSYQELDTLSSQFAHYLQQHYNSTIGDGIVVKLAHDEWFFIAIMSVLKMGCFFIPVAVDFPEKRIEYISKNSQSSLCIDAAFIKEFTSQKNNHTKDYKTTPIHSDTTCYSIYTSGTTGKPKGVLIPHKAVVNYVDGFIATNNITEKDSSVVLSSLAFDLIYTSVFPCLLSGATLFVPTTSQTKNVLEITDVIAAHTITFLKVTPSYLNVLLDVSENILVRDTALRLMVSGGESPIQKDVEKIVNSGIHVLNHYGPTEATIGTCTHLITRENLKAFTENPVIGTPVFGNYIYVLDASLQLVPKGVIGELYIGGNGLAKGYVNAEETALKFIADPYRTGKKIYKTGDYGKMLPNGTIQFLGRKDKQFKINGYRIETQEIKNVLLAHKAITNAHITVVANDGQQLILAFVVGTIEDSADIKEYLGQFLPAYMLPRHIYILAEFPMNKNGKIIEEALLKSVDITHETTSNYVPPSSEIEKILAATWQEVLGAKPIGIKDVFFELGGDSIKAIQILSRVGAHGFTFDLTDILKYPTIEQLSSFVKIKKRKIPQAPVVGDVSLSPIQLRFLNNKENIHHFFNYSFLYKSSLPLAVEKIKKTFEILSNHHDILRASFSKKASDWTQTIQKETTYNFYTFETTADEFVLEKSQEIQEQINVTDALIGLAVFKDEEKSLLFFTFHHLIIDIISWYTLKEDFENIYQSLLHKQTIALPEKTDSYKYWVQQQVAKTQTEAFQTDIAYWQQFQEELHTPTFKNTAQLNNTFEQQQVASFQFSEEETLLFQEIPQKKYNINIEEVLITGLVAAFSNTFHTKNVLIDVESHGRHETLEATDISRTVGWFTSIYPMQLRNYATLRERIVHTKETLRNVPNKGISFGIYKYLSDTTQKFIQPQLRINYIGTVDSTTVEDGFLSLQPGVYPISKKRTRDYIIDIQARIQHGKLHVQCNYPKDFLSASKIEALLAAYKQECHEIITHCQSLQTQKYTPSDFTFSDFSIAEMEASKLFEADNVVDILPMSLLQKGIFYHYRKNTNSKAYFEQKNFKLSGNFIASQVAAAFQKVLDKYSILRTSFTDDIGGDLLQVVKGNQQLNFNYHDVSEVSEEIRNETLKTIKDKDIQDGFDVEKDTLIRLNVFKLAPSVFEFCLSHHHILFDGWCNSLIFNDFFKAYIQLQQKVPIDIGSEIPFSNYINWLTKRDNSEAVRYWKELLFDYDQGVKVPYEKNIVVEDASKLHDRYTFHITEEETTALQRLANSSRVTLNTLISGIWGMLLAKYNNTKDVVFGAVVSGRPGDLQHVERMVGLFINTIPVRVRFGEDSFENVVKNHQQFWIDSQAHQYLQLSEIQANSQLKDQLINHLYVFENYPSLSSLNENKKNLDFEFIDFEVYEQSNYNFAMIVMPGTELHFGFSYDANLFETADLQKIERHLKNCIQQIIKNPTRSIAEIDMVTPTEKQILLTDFKGFEEERNAEDTLVSLIQNQAIHLPNQVAVLDAENAVSYAELDQFSAKIANYLVENNIPKGKNIGILYHKSTTYIGLILGILKAGCSYVPLDSNWPQKRKKEVLNQAEIPLIFIGTSEIPTANILQWECNALQTYVCVDADDPYTILENESPLMSQELWNHIASTATDAIEAGGWVSSFTGLPFSELEMQEYSENVLYRVRPYLNKTKRVLEIGCASGITMFAVAPHVKEYIGLDISSEVIQTNREKIQREGIQNISCYVKGAAEIDTLDLGAFDIVIINSVIQCFPGLNYLREILSKACSVVAKDGMLFLGDIMNQDTKQTMLDDLLEYQQTHQNSKTKLVFDTELFVSPIFFLDYVAQHQLPIKPIVCGKKYTISNELTTYRYDVIFEMVEAPNQDAEAIKQQHGKGEIECQSSENFNSEILAEAAAYMIFTSGTTGKSKGVRVTHQNIINTLKWRERVYEFSKEDNILSIPAFHFDASVEDIFGALIVGATLCIPDQQKTLDTTYLSNFIQDQKVTNFIAVPTFYEVLVDELQGKNLHLKTITVAGEALTQTVLEKHYKMLPYVKLFNEYGPTETAVCVTFKEMKPTDSITIGKPIDNMEILILDADNKLLPLGISGEITIGGIGVSLGYYNDVENTRQKFIPHPYKKDAIVYKTGDLGKWLPNGELEFLGRNDHQVKIRGFRVELTEIEAVLETHSLIRRAVVSNQDDRLLAFVELLEAQDVDTEILLHHAVNRLPSYMIPAKIEVIDAIPLTPNNKIDRKKIKTFSLKTHQKTGIQLPETEREKTLASVWKEVLRTTNEISTEDNFFELGGDSIKSMLVVSKLKKRNYHVSVTNVLNAPTLKEQASKLTLKDHANIAYEIAEKSALLPIQSEFVAQFGTIPSQFNLAIALVNKDTTDRWLPDAVQEITHVLVQQHDALQRFFTQEDAQWVMHRNAAMETEKPLYFDYRDGKGSLEDMQEIATEKLHKSIGIQHGPLLKTAIFDFDEESRLVIVIHHFVMDVISWRILIKDFLKLKALQLEEKVLKLEDKKFPYGNWIQELKSYGNSHAFQKEQAYWEAIATQETSQIVADMPNGDCSSVQQTAVALTVSAEKTEHLLTEANKMYACRMDDIMLAVLGIAMQRVFNAERTKIHMESHGRAEINEAVDVNETVGWFTCKYPVILAPQYELEQTLMHTKETLRKIPNLGIGYGIHHHLMQEAAAREAVAIMYNNLGSFDTESEQMSYNQITVSQAYTGEGIATDSPISYDLYLRNIMVNGEIQLTINYNTTRFHSATIHKLKNCISDLLEEVIQLVGQTENVVITPSDLGENDLSLDEFEALF